MRPLKGKTHFVNWNKSLIKTTVLLKEDSGALDPCYYVVAGSIFAIKVDGLAPFSRRTLLPLRQIISCISLYLLFEKVLEFTRFTFCMCHRGTTEGLALKKAGDSNSARLSTRSSLGANYISSVHWIKHQKKWKQMATFLPSTKTIKYTFLKIKNEEYASRGVITTDPK